MGGWGLGGGRPPTPVPLVSATAIIICKITHSTGVEEGGGGGHHFLDMFAP